MSQKVNSKSTKIGINQLWLTKTQKYGNNFYNFNLFFFYNKKKIDFILKISKLKILFINEIKLLNKYSLFVLKIYIKKSNGFNINLLANYFYWFNLKKKLIIKLYNNSKVDNTYILLNYIEYLFNNLNYSVKKISIILALLLKKKLNSKKVVFLKNGPVDLIFKGYKIKLSGRIDNQKNQMAKSIIFKEGSLTLTNLNSYIDFKNINLNTKLGVCNIKIWLFYKNL